MKKQTKSTLSNSLQTLGIIGLMLFAMAFACDDDNRRKIDSDKSDGAKQSKTTTTRKNSGRCSTEEEFKNLLIESFSKTFNERDGKFKDTEVDFQSFDLGEPFRFRTSYPEVIDAEPAYPVTTSYIKRDYLGEKSFPKIHEVRVTDYQYIFYTDHRGNCVFSFQAGKGTSETNVIPINR